MYGLAEKGQARLEKSYDLGPGLDNRARGPVGVEVVGVELTESFRVVAVERFEIRIKFLFDAGGRHDDGVQESLEKRAAAVIAMLPVIIDVRWAALE